MRICLISGSFPNMQCGVGDYCAHLAVGLANAGATVSVLTSSHPKIAQRRREHSTDGVRIVDVVRRWDFSRLSGIRQAIDDIQPDVLHIEYQTGTFDRKAAVNFVVLFTRRGHGHPRIVTTFHDCSTPYLFPRAPRQLREYTLLPLLYLSDRVIVSNHRDRARLSRLCPGVQSRITAIPVGSNPVYDPRVNPDLGELRKDLSMAADEHLISCFGFVRDDRDNEVLLSAMRMLMADGLRVRLVFIGGFEKNHKTFRGLVNTVKGSGMSRSVSFTGYLPPALVSRFLKASDVHVFCHRDGVTTARCSLITPLSHGIPTIATSLGDEPNCFIDRENIILVPPRDVEALASSVKDLLLSPGLRKKLSENALALAKTFSWEAIVGRHLTVYTQVLSSKPSHWRS